MTLSKRQMAKYRRLNRRIVRRLPVTRAEAMWVWDRRFRYLATVAPGSPQ